MLFNIKQKIETRLKIKIKFGNWIKRGRAMIVCILYKNLCQKTTTREKLLWDRRFFVLVV